jgi:hypothetical protein
VRTVPSAKAVIRSSAESSGNSTVIVPTDTWTKPAVRSKVRNVSSFAYRKNDGRRLVLVERADIDLRHARTSGQSSRFTPIFTSTGSHVRLDGHVRW